MVNDTFGNVRRIVRRTVDFKKLSGTVAAVWGRLRMIGVMIILMMPAKGTDSMKSLKVIARMFGLVDSENSSNATRNIHSFFICPPTPLMATIDCLYNNGPRKPVKN